jgi:hypothetical protein
MVVRGAYSVERVDREPRMPWAQVNTNTLGKGGHEEQSATEDGQSSVFSVQCLGSGGVVYISQLGVRGARREHRPYKYMHIYLCTTLLLGFLEVRQGVVCGCEEKGTAGLMPAVPCNTPF